LQREGELLLTPGTRLAELKRLRSLVEKEGRRVQASPPPPPAPAEQRPRFTAVGIRENGRMGATENEHDRRWRAS
jgi:hypothetical protein